MNYFSVFILVCSAFIFAKGMVQMHQTKREWHQARYSDKPRPVASQNEKP